MVRRATRLLSRASTAGTLAARDHVVFHRRTASGTVADLNGRVTNVATFSQGAQTEPGPACAGDIAEIVGLHDIEIGDQLGRWDPSRGGRFLPAPGLEAVVRARRPGERTSLFNALRQLSQQDPLINARLDGIDHDLTVSLYGEVQKEVLTARLATEFGVGAEFLPTQTVYVERVTGVGQALQVIGTPGNTTWPRSGCASRRDRSTPASRTDVRWSSADSCRTFHTAIEETVPTALEEGPHGWRVIDCVVSLAHSGSGRPSRPPGTSGG